MFEWLWWRFGKLPPPPPQPKASSDSVVLILAAEAVSFLRVLAEPGGCQHCGLIGSAGFHLHSAQGAVTTSWQTPPPPPSSSWHHSCQLTLPWHRPWCQPCYVSPSRRPADVIAPNSHAKAWSFLFFQMTPTECILGGVNGGKLQIQVRGRTVSASSMSGVIRRHQCFRVEVSPAGETLPAVTCCQPFPISRYQAVCSRGGEAAPGGSWPYLSRKRPEGESTHESRLQPVRVQGNLWSDVLLCLGLECRLSL